MSEKVGLFGGTFNPIHFGHLITARSVLEQLALDWVVFIPSANPPHKSPAGLIDAEHRLEMVRLAVEGEPGFALEDCEIRRGGPSYTVETVAYFRERLGAQADVFWIIGADSLPELPSWYRIAELVEACRIVTASRPGWETPDLTPLRRCLNDRQIARLGEMILQTPRIDISATQIRARVRQGRSIRYLVPEAVREYILARGLYRS